jgi:hypothetical protein
MHANFHRGKFSSDLSSESEGLAETRRVTEAARERRDEIGKRQDQTSVGARARPRTYKQSLQKPWGSPGTFGKSGWLRRQRQAAGPYAGGGR